MYVKVYIFSGMPYQIHLTLPLQIKVTKGYRVNSYKAHQNKIK